MLKFSQFRTLLLVFPAIFASHSPPSSLASNPPSDSLFVYIHVFAAKG